MIQVLPEWNTDDDLDYDVVLRGLNRFVTKKHHYNIIWNIYYSHKVTIEEYNDYDYVFIASYIWKNYISPLCDIEVQTLL